MQLRILAQITCVFLAACAGKTPEPKTTATCANGICEDQQKQQATTQPLQSTPQEETAPVVSVACESAPERIHFDFNEDVLTKEAQQTLQKYSECLKKNLILEGHCDDRGTQEYNLALGERRAINVKNYLKNLGMQNKQLLIRSKGENEPLCLQKTEECHAQNRRVEFITP